MKRTIKWFFNKTGGHKKIYLLRDEINNRFEEVFYLKNWLGKKRVVRGRSFTYQEVYKKFEKITSEGIFQNTPLKKLFWQNADKELRLATFFSYLYRQEINYPRIINVETNNWLDSPFFQDQYQQLIKQIRLRKALFIKTIFNSIARTKGFHDINFRFDNIHLVKDNFNNQAVYAVHWDFSPPNSFPLSWLWHRIKDR